MGVLYPHGQSHQGPLASVVSWRLGMVVRQPPVLLLDECTSALDPTTQEAAQKTILKDFPRQGGQGLGGQAAENGGFAAVFLDDLDVFRASTRKRQGVCAVFFLHCSFFFLLFPCFFWSILGWGWWEGGLGR